MIFKKNNSLKNKLYRITGFKPIRMAPYREALRHGSSQKLEKPIKIVQSNERLEFLGDALLDAIVADILFRKFPTEQEGFLTEMRSRVVNRNQMSYMANRIGLYDLMDFSEDVRLNKIARKMLEGNALEALIAAVYIDRGYEGCYTFIQKRLIGQYLDLETLMATRISHKAEFIKWCQQNKHEFKWEYADESGKSRKIHVVSLYIDDELWFTEKNFSRKNAEELCCEKGLRKVETQEGKEASE